MLRITSTLSEMQFTSMKVTGRCGQPSQFSTVSPQADFGRYIWKSLTPPRSSSTGCTNPASQSWSPKAMFYFWMPHLISAFSIACWQVEEMVPAAVRLEALVSFTHHRWPLF